MTRDESAWHEAMREGYKPAWHISRDYPGAPLKCYYIDPTSLRLHAMEVHQSKVRWGREARLHAALRRFWRALKG